MYHKSNRRYSLFANALKMPPPKCSISKKRWYQHNTRGIVRPTQTAGHMFRDRLCWPGRVVYCRKGHSEGQNTFVLWDHPFALRKPQQHTKFATSTIQHVSCAHNPTRVKNILVCNTPEHVRECVYWYSNRVCKTWCSMCEYMCT